MMQDRLYGYTAGDGVSLEYELNTTWGTRVAEEIGTVKLEFSDCLFMVLTASSLVAFFVIPRNQNFIYLSRMGFLKSVLFLI